MTSRLSRTRLIALVGGILFVFVGMYYAFSSPDFGTCAPVGGCISAINDYYYIDWGIAALVVGIAVIFMAFLERVPGTSSSKTL